MFLHHFLPGTFIFTSSHPSPIYSPLFLSPVAHTIPQTNQFASLLSLLPSMPGPALSFVSRRYLHFQRPRINLSLMPPSITPPTNLPSPRPTYSFQGAQSIDSPATSDYHAVSVRSSVCECVRMRFVGWGVMGSLAIRLGQAEVFEWGVGLMKAPQDHYTGRVTFGVEDGWRAGGWLGRCVCALAMWPLTDLHIQQTSSTTALQKWEKSNSWWQCHASQISLFKSLWISGCQAFTLIASMTIIKIRVISQWKFPFICGDYSILSISICINVRWLTVAKLAPVTDTINRSFIPLNSCVADKNDRLTSFQQQRSERDCQMVVHETENN